LLGLKYWYRSIRVALALNGRYSESHIIFHICVCTARLGATFQAFAQKPMTAVLEQRAKSNLPS
jgi:hypothetical protein